MLESIEWVEIIYLIVIFINIILLLGLSRIYIKSYRDIQLGFTVGLLIFAILFLIKNIIAFGLTLEVVLSNTSSILIDRLFIMSLIELIGFSVLYKVTLK